MSKRIRTKKTIKIKKVNLEGYYHHKSGKFVGPYKRKAKQYPNHYVTQRIDPKTGQLRWVEVTKTPASGGVHASISMKYLDQKPRGVPEVPISREQARKAFENQPLKSRVIDLQKRAKKVYPADQITSGYLKSPGRKDVEGIDTPPKEDEVKEEEKKKETITPKRITIKITEDDKKKVADLREKYGFNSIISPTAYKRDKPLGDKQYNDYLKEKEQELKEDKLYNKVGWDAHHYLNENIQAPSNYKILGKKESYEEYIQEIEQRIKKAKDGEQKKLDEQAKLRIEKEKKMLEDYAKIFESVKTSDDLKRTYDNYHGPRSIDLMKQYDAKFNELKTKELETEKTLDATDVTVKSWNNESYQILKNARGQDSDEKITAEDILRRRFGKMAVITGPSTQWGIERSWLGDTEWRRSGGVKSISYSEDELDILPLGSLVEIEGKKFNKEIYKKISNDEWKLVAEKEDFSQKIYGVVSKMKTKIRTQQELQILVEESDDIGTRISALKQITNESFLDEIARTDENYKMKSFAYQRLKELNPKSPKLIKLREFYQQSKEQEKEAIKQYNDNVFYGKIINREKAIDALRKISDLNTLKEAMQKRDDEIALIAYEQMKINRPDVLKEMKYKLPKYAFLNEKVVEKIKK